MAVISAVKAIKAFYLISLPEADKISMLGIKRRLNYFRTKEQFLDWFFSHPDHKWIVYEKFVYANLLDFFEFFPLKHINKIYESQEVVLYPSSGRFACSVQKSEKSIIIIFPELKRLLDAPFDGWAKAVLAHEYGHLFHKHGSRFTDPLEAQVEADRFAVEMGYIEKLIEFLEEQPESVEKRTRLAYATSQYFESH